MYLKACAAAEIHWNLLLLMYQPKDIIVDEYGRYLRSESTIAYRQFIRCFGSFLGVVQSQYTMDLVSAMPSETKSSTYQTRLQNDLVEYDEILLCHCNYFTAKTVY
jgi:hypothetical protein